MGELVVGKPALKLTFPVSLTLDLASALSLFYRAVPGSGLDPWLIASRRGLPADVVSDLDLLHGFSGRLLYYMEEPAMRFAPLRSDRLDASADDLFAFLDDVSADEYRAMAVRSLARVHRDLGSAALPPEGDDPVAWRRYLLPALTTAEPDDVIALLDDSVQLKRRTVALFRGVWEHGYADEWTRREPALREAAALARETGERGFPQAFADLTGNRVPAGLATGLGDVGCVAFCPSYHLGPFVSYVLYPPDVVVFFSAPDLLDRAQSTAEVGTTESQTSAADDAAAVSAVRSAGDLSGEATLDALRALADPNRLRILDLLGGGELYAQEIVSRLGIAQSAVSRHLSLLERAGLVQVAPRRGMKYYAVAGARVLDVADAIRSRAER